MDESHLALLPHPLEDSKQLTLQLRNARERGLWGILDVVKLEHKVALMEQLAQLELRLADTMLARTEKLEKLLVAQKKELEARAALERAAKPQPLVSVYRGQVWNEEE